MDGRELRERRRRRGLTQDQVARAIETVHKRQSLHRRGDNRYRITQSMVSQMERGVRPIPRKPRYYPGTDIAEDPLNDELDWVLGLPDDELREVVGDAPRGPYRGPAG